MRCPNCPSSFTLRADYAAHVSRCLPRDAGAGREALIARLNAAASRLHTDFDRAEDESPGSTLDPAA